jgi:hypothetical protein
VDRGAESGSRVSINRNEWLKAVADAEAKAREVPESDAMTVQEFAAMIGMNRIGATARLRTLVEMGKAERTRKKIRRSDGVVITANAYRLLS